MARNRVIIAILSVIIIVVAAAYYQLHIRDTFNAYTVKYKKLAKHDFQFMEYKNGYFIARPQEAIDGINFEYKLLQQGYCDIIFGDDKKQRERLSNYPILTQITATLDGYCIKPTKSDYLTIIKALLTISYAKESDYIVLSNNQFDFMDKSLEQSGYSMDNVFYKHAYKAGDNSHIATALLGEMYYFGHGVDQDITKANKLFRNAVLGHAGVILAGPRPIPYDEDMAKQQANSDTLYLSTNTMSLDGYLHATGKTLWEINANFGDSILGLRNWPKPMLEEIRWFNSIRDDPGQLYALSQNLWSGNEGYPAMPHAAFSILDALVFHHKLVNRGMNTHWVTWSYAPILDRDTDSLLTSDDTAVRASKAHHLVVKSARAHETWSIPLTYCLTEVEETPNNYEFSDKDYILIFAAQNNLITNPDVIKKLKARTTVYANSLGRSKYIYYEAIKKKYFPIKLSHEPIDISECMKNFKSY